MGAILLALAVVAAADEEADPRAPIDKAIKALGGAEKVARGTAFVRKAKGTYQAAGAAVAFVGEWTVGYPDRVRVELSSEGGPTKYQLVKAISSERGWLREDGPVEDLDPATLLEEREQLYAAYVAALLPLADKDAKTFTLADAGSERVHDRPAIGVKVTSAGHRPVILFFDREKGWPVKYETAVRVGGREAKQEVFLSDYKDADGLSRPHRVVVKRDGRTASEIDVTEFKTLEKVDGRLFARP